MSGAASDMIGRAPVLRWALTLATLAAGTAALAPNLETLVVLRILAGTGVGAATPPLFSLATELAPPGRSGPAIALVATFWMVGSVVAAGLALAILSSTASAPPSFGADEAWRPFALACSVVPTLSMILAWTVRLEPPSPDGDEQASLKAVDATARAPTLGGVLAALLETSTRAALLPLMLVWFGLNFGSCARAPTHHHCASPSRACAWEGGRRGNDGMRMKREPG